MQKSYSETLELLENLIDYSDCNIAGLLNMVAEVCLLKESHIASNWQDVGLAEQWGYIANHLNKLADQLPSHMQPQNN